VALQPEALDNFTIMTTKIKQSTTITYSTQYRSFQRHFVLLQVWWSNRQCQITGGSWLVIQIAINLNKLSSPCNNNTTYMHK